MTYQIKEHKVTKCVLLKGPTPSARTIHCPRGSRQLACRCDGGGPQHCPTEASAGGWSTRGGAGHVAVWSRAQHIFLPSALFFREHPQCQHGPGGHSLSALFSSSGQLITHLGSDFPPGAGVLDVMYESPSTLLSCGYDTYVRYWDLRTSTR